MNNLKEEIKNYIIYLFFAFVISLIAYITKSRFLNEFLYENTIILLITILSGFIAIFTLLATKIYNLKINNEKFNGKLVVKEIKKCFTEMLIFLILSLLVLILNSYFELFIYWFLIRNSILLLSIIVFIVRVLDMAKSIFILLEFSS